MATVTEDDVWELVDNVDFSQPKEEVEAKITLRLAPAELKLVRDKERELQMRLRDAALEHDDKPDWVSEDGMAESAGAVIGKGKERYYEVLEDPALFWAEEYENHGNPILSSYLPFRSAYRKLTDGYYRNRGKDIAKKYVDLKDNEKYAESYRKAATTLFHLLDEATRTLRGNNRHDALHMIDLAEKLEDDVDPRYVRNLIQDYKLYRQGYFDV